MGSQLSIPLCACGCGEPTARIEVTNRSMGRIAGEYNRYVKGHNPRKVVQPYEVDPETGCWVWQRGRTGDGYGALTRNYKTLAAHVVSYEEHVGSVPEGFHVHHRCENPPCVNPAHLEALSPKGHAKTKNFARGERNNKAILTDETARQVRDLADQGWFQQDIADAFGVTQTVVSAIKLRKTWRHLGESWAVR